MPLDKSGGRWVLLIICNWFNDYGMPENETVSEACTDSCPDDERGVYGKEWYQRIWELKLKALKESYGAVIE